MKMKGKKILVAHQPNYWPYPGLLSKIAHADVFIYMSSVQLNTHSWQTRNLIKSANGSQYFNVPIITKNRRYQQIRDVEICYESKWQGKFINAIKTYYGKAPYFKKYFPILQEIYSKEWQSLNELKIYITNFLLNELNIKPAIFYDTDFEFSAHKTDLLVQMCKELNCNFFLSNKGSSAYVEIEKFNANNIDHMYMDWICPKYPQLFGNFIPNLSILDMLFNCGPEATEEIIKDDKNCVFSEVNSPL